MEKETLEEAFDRIFDSIDYTEFDFTSFEQGAKYQARKMYSEEEVINFLQEMNNWLTTFEGKIDIKDWLKQFKKK